MEIGPFYQQDSMYYRTGNQLVDEFNEYMTDTLGHDFRLPTKKEVCPQCDGEGKMVNRSIDGQGLSMDDPNLDEDFWEGYWGGRYDVVCDECRGNNVVDVVDESRLDPDMLREWQDWTQSNWECVQENLAELRMGA